MYSDVFCKVYNEFGWNYYPEIFADQLMLWLQQNHVEVHDSMDLACGTGVLCRILRDQGIDASGMDFSAGMIDIAKQQDPAGHYDVADMTLYRPDKQFDLITCTGDAINHISSLPDIKSIFRNVFHYTRPGGYFIFDLLNENEIATSEPFEMDYEENRRIWFQMTRPTIDTVNLKIRVFEKELQLFEENIRETLYAPALICNLLEECGFKLVKCADSLPDHTDQHGTTWFIIARK